MAKPCPSSRLRIHLLGLFLSHPSFIPGSLAVSSVFILSNGLCDMTLVHDIALAVMSPGALISYHCGGRPYRLSVTLRGFGKAASRLHDKTTCGSAHEVTP